MTRKKYQAIGLMSGTSLDGIDVALLETDGLAQVTALGGATFSYDPLFRDQMRLSLGKKPNAGDPHIAWLENEITKRHALAVQTFLRERGIMPADIHLIGFHGQTIWHNPREKETVQLGDGALLAELTCIDVVHDFRTADVQAGGQGAPLVPLYHRALAHALPKPLAVVNIGGVSNVTWIGGEGDGDILAFDCGPGNALLDDWMLEKTGKACDTDGTAAASGRIDPSHMEMFLHHPYFAKKPPKSLDRDAFKNFVPRSLETPDGAATLTMMTVQAIVEGLGHAPAPPLALYVTGGGRLNATMMRLLAERSGLPVQSVDALGWRGDYLEAEAFAYLAVRSVLGLPLTLPTTTGVGAPMGGGRHSRT